MYCRWMCLTKLSGEPELTWSTHEIELPAGDDATISRRQGESSNYDRPAKLLPGGWRSLFSSVRKPGEWVACQSLAHVPGVPPPTILILVLVLTSNMLPFRASHAQ